MWENNLEKNSKIKQQISTDPNAHIIGMCIFRRKQTYKIQFLNYVWACLVEITKYEELSIQHKFYLARQKKKNKQPRETALQLTGRWDS